MDFFDHQDRARRNTFILIGYFVVAVVSIIISVYAAAIGCLALIQSRTEESVLVGWWQPEIFFAVLASVLLIIVTGSLYKISVIGSSGEHIAIALGGQKLQANTTDLAERILLNVVEEMALASGTAVPPVYLMRNENGINAFAAGTTPQNAVLGITQGAIETLSRDELQGVIAHEFSHILNGDMRLNLRLMGLLHGILVIALIGYMILRLVGNSPGHRSSSRDDKKGEGAFLIAILAMGAALLAIGYIGVFFAQLIKSAVSRQREFLADASAVQFTRNPSGISDALKKIGGWSASSRIQSPRAEESSHLFFGNAMLHSVFATHPPLMVRVQRLDPTFRGPFPKTSILTHSASEIIEPHSLSALHSSFQEAHAAAVEGADRMSSDPRRVVESVGDPQAKHIDHVHGLVDDLEPILADDIRDPLGAVAVIYGLLLAPAQSEIRSKQLDQLSQQSDQRPVQELQRVLIFIDRLLPEQRLPVACLALPALHQMSLPQIQGFYLTIQNLIQFDQTVTLFEYAVHRFISKRLLPRLRGTKAIVVDNNDSISIQSAFTVVLSALAYASGESKPITAFAAGLGELGARDSNLTLLELSDCDLAKLDTALDRLATAPMRKQKRMLTAFSACIASDKHVTIQEAELLRVIADALGCPVPPIL